MNHLNLARAQELFDNRMASRVELPECTKVECIEALNVWLRRGSTCTQAAMLVEAALLEGNPLT